MSITDDVVVPVLDHHSLAPGRMIGTVVIARAQDHPRGPGHTLVARRNAVGRARARVLAAQDLDHHDSGSDTSDDENDRSRRRGSHSSSRHKKKKRSRSESGRHKKKKHRRRHSSSSSSEDSDTEVRRSAITGQKIKLKVAKSSEDKKREKNRGSLLEFLNASYD
ncbi:hypothetical protein BGW41_002803 [Actinomortierella wolfii]|nr:hypothetical protein BGW41_002803 [Actinomortierella wolfii]